MTGNFKLYNSYHGLPGRNPGVTLLELLIVIGIIGVVTAPVWLILRAGSRQSLQGMLAIETTLEARRVLESVRHDLETAVFPTVGWNLDVARKEQLLDILQAPPTPAYRLLCFPRLPGAAGPTDASGAARSRRADRITWRLLPASGTLPPGDLVREEEPNPAVGGEVRRQVLSRRVNLFSIHRELADHSDPVTGRVVTAVSYRVTLQLVDRLPDAEPVSAAPGADRPREARGVIVSDFVDVVVPEFLHGKRLQPFASQNWHSGIAGFSEGFEPPW